MRFDGKTPKNGFLPTGANRNLKADIGVAIINKISPVGK